MERTDVDFTDGLALDLFSPKNRTVRVTQNPSPLPGNFVVGSTGEPFIALSSYSYIVKTNDSAKDLVGAKIEIPLDSQQLEQNGIDRANTYVGTLRADGKAWVIDENQRNIHK